MIFAVLGLALPSFWLGYNLIWLFAVKWQLMPAVGYESIFKPPDEGGGINLGPWLRSITLPSITIGVISAALITRMTRSSMLEVLREDYIRTARAKGLGEFVVLIRHGFKNAGLPVVTIIGLGIAGLVTGSGHHGGRVRHPRSGTADGKRSGAAGLPDNPGCGAADHRFVRVHQSVRRPDVRLHGPTNPIQVGR